MANRSNALPHPDSRCSTSRKRPSSEIAVRSPATQRIETHIEPSRQPPARTSPRVGELVEVRSRRWLVEGVEDAAPPTSPRVSLACADDDAQGQTLEVYWDFEIDRRILEQEAWSTIGAKGFDSPRHFSAFLHTLRWSCVTATDPNLFQSPFRAGIKIDAYQDGAAAQGAAPAARESLHRRRHRPGQDHRGRSHCS